MNTTKISLRYNGSKFQVNGRGPWLTPYTLMGRIESGSYRCFTPSGDRTFVRETGGWSFSYPVAIGRGEKARKT